MQREGGLGVDGRFGERERFGEVFALWALPAGDVVLGGVPQPLPRSERRQDRSRVTDPLVADELHEPVGLRPTCSASSVAVFPGGHGG